ncbi:MAG: hypothetical protein ABJH04_12280 [Cyclobacteriaceae bacterium]
MPEWLIVLLVLAGLVAVVGLLIKRNLAADAKRAAHLKSFAEKKGLSYSEAVEYTTVHDKFKSLPTFQKGTDFYVENFIHGNLNGANIAIFDYMYWNAYETHRRGGKAHRTEGTKIRQTPICLHIANANIPAFDITINSNLYSYTSYPNGGLVKFEEENAFTKNYIVRAASEEDVGKVKKMISKEVQDFLAPLKNLKVEAAGDAVLVTQTNIPIKHPALDGYIKAAVAMLPILEDKS